MRVLMLTPYVTINSRPEFSRNKTGFGYMVYDIARAVGVTEHVDVLASDTKGQAFVSDGVHFLKRSFALFIINFFRCLSPFVVWKLWRRYRMSMGALIRLVYYCFISGYYQKVINTGHYDIVHIHGCGFSTELWMLICKKCGQKFVVTLHGLNSFSDTVKLEPAGKQYERDFLQRVTQGEIPITVISTGMKRLIEQTYRVQGCPFISVVCNSFSFPDNDISRWGGQNNTSMSIKEKYNIPSGGKVLLYVGNISENKNQHQIVKAFKLLPKDLHDNTWIMFCGRPSNDGQFEEMIQQQSDSQHFVLCGIVEKNEMTNYYREADGVVLLSQSEGFGLSLIEGMHFGVPCLMFTDMDAFEDIYDANAVIGVIDRGNQSVVEGIIKLLSTPWNRDAIKAYSRRFDSAVMAQNYIKAYKQ